MATHPNACPGRLAKYLSEYLHADLRRRFLLTADEIFMFKHLHTSTYVKKKKKLCKEKGRGTGRKKGTEMKQWANKRLSEPNFP